jgi:hypothetical protein
MRTIALLILIAVTCRAEAFGTWKVNPARSTSNGSSHTESLTVRIGPHAKGEVFTLDKTEKDGRATTSSTILYLDGKPRDFQEANCSGTQSSRRVNKETVEIIRHCNGGAWIRFVRRLAAQPKELILEITEQEPNGRRFERRMVLEKQQEEN